MSSLYHPSLSVSENSDSPTRFNNELNERLSTLNPDKRFTLDTPKPAEKIIISRSPVLVRKSSITVVPSMSRSVHLDREESLETSTSKKTAIKAVDVVYVQREELEPVENPELEFMDYLKTDPNE